MQSDLPPVNPLPKVILFGFAVMAIVELVCALGAAGVVGGAQGVGWRAQAVAGLGFSPRVQALLFSGHGDPVLLLRYISYPLVHDGFTHAAFALALWLALGKYVGERFRPWAVIAIVLTGIVGAAVAHGIAGQAVGQNMPLYGAYPADYALIGAYTYLMWVQNTQRGENRFAAFTLIGVLIGLQVLFRVVFGSSMLGGVADLGGFVCGGIAAIIVAPGNLRAFLRWTRRG